MKTDPRYAGFLFAVIALVALLISLPVFKVFRMLDVVPEETKEHAGDFAKAAKGEPIPAAAEYRPIPGRHPVVLLDNEGNLIKGSSFVAVADPSWFAKSVEELELVVVLRKVEEEKFGEAFYSKSGSNQNAFSVGDYRIVHHVELIEARSAKVIARQRFVGPTGAAERKSGYGRVVGNPPDWIPWVGGYVIQKSGSPEESRAVKCLSALEALQQLHVVDGADVELPESLRDPKAASDVLNTLLGSGDLKHPVLDQLIQSFSPEAKSELAGKLLELIRREKWPIEARRVWIAQLVLDQPAQTFALAALSLVTPTNFEAPEASRLLEKIVQADAVHEEVRLHAAGRLSEGDPNKKAANAIAQFADAYLRKHVLTPPEYNQLADPAQAEQMIARVRALRECVDRGRATQDIVPSLLATWLELSNRQSKGVAPTGEPPRYTLLKPLIAFAPDHGELQRLVFDEFDQAMAPFNPFLYKAERMQLELARVDALDTEFVAVIQLLNDLPLPGYSREVVEHRLEVLSRSSTVHIRREAIASQGSLRFASNDLAPPSERLLAEATKQHWSDSAGLYFPGVLRACVEGEAWFAPSQSSDVLDLRIVPLSQLDPRDRLLAKLWLRTHAGKERAISDEIIAIAEQPRNWGMRNSALAAKHGTLVSVKDGLLQIATLDGKFVAIPIEELHPRDQFVIRIWTDRSEKAEGETGMNPRLAAMADGPRIWTDKQGNTIQALLVEVRSGMVHLRVDEKQLVKIPLKRISELDQLIIQKWRERQTTAKEAPKQED